MPETYAASSFDGRNRSVEIPVDREVLSCKYCGLVQYRTRTGNCRRCIRRLPPKTLAAGPYPKPRTEPNRTVRPSRLRNLQRVRLQGNDKWLNLEMVENIGRRIQQFRESRGLTQSKLQELSNVSRSYLSRIEIGQMTPSLGTIEKISEALGISLNRLFSARSNCDALLEDPFIQQLRPVLRGLSRHQRQQILKRIAVVGNQAWVRDEQQTAKAQPNRVEYDGAIGGANESRAMAGDR